MSYRYLGNKTRLTDWIVGEIAGVLPAGSSIADPMCGTASVSVALAHAGYSVTASDALTFPVVHARTRLLVKETPTFEGLGGYQRALTDRYGFPRGYKSRRKQHFGFATGDMVRAHVPTGKKAGTHAGRVAVRATGSFKVGTVDGINHKHITLTQRGDGYMHHHTNTPKEVAALPPLPHGRGFRAGLR